MRGALLAFAAVAAAVLVASGTIGATPFVPVELPDEAFVPVVVPPTEKPPPASTAVPAPRIPRARPSLPPAPVVTKPVEPRTTLTGSTLSGLASWYCRAGVSICHYKYPDTKGFDAYAAAGPKLRAAICGSSKSDCWRGRTVTVSANGQSVSVRLTDFCQCYRGESHEKVIDLYWDVWAALGIPNGSNRVKVAW